MIWCGLHLDIKKSISHCKNNFTNKQNSRNWCHTRPIIKIQQNNINNV